MKETDSKFEAVEECALMDLIQLACRVVLRGRENLSARIRGGPVTNVSIGGWQRDGATSGEAPTHSSDPWGSPGLTEQGNIAMAGDLGSQR